MSPTHILYLIIVIIITITIIYYYIFFSKQKSNDNISISEQKLIKKILNNPSPNIVIATHNKSSLYLKQKDLKILLNNKWLNDEIINFYFALLMDKIINNKSKSNRILFLNSFFYTKLTENGYNYNNVRRWTKKIEKKNRNKWY